MYRLNLFAVPGFSPTLGTVTGVRRVLHQKKKGGGGSMTCFPQNPAFGPRFPGSKDGKQTVLGTQRQGILGRH